MTEALRLYHVKVGANTTHMWLSKSDAEAYGDDATAADGLDAPSPAEPRSRSGAADVKARTTTDNKARDARNKKD